jgi:hypothetical protein
MTNQEMQPKFEQILQDETLARAFLSSETPEAAKEFLANQGIDISLEEVTALGKALADSAPGELSEEQLSDVAGGMLMLPLGWNVLSKKLQLMHKVYAWLKTW